MTRSTVALENAHIIPKNPSDVNWWRVNAMFLYVGQNQTYNSVRNKIWLRVNVHQILDHKPRFTIVPKYDALVAHFFGADEAAEAAELYHNVPLQDLDGARIEFLLARMTWTLFPHLGNFLMAKMRRKISRLDDNGDRVIEELDGDKCTEIYRKTQGKPRSVSPRKRTIGQSIGEADELEDLYSKQDDSDEADDEWNARGRKRRGISYTPSGEELDPSGSEVSVSADAIVLASLRT